jgi:hypothetical protein
VTRVLVTVSQLSHALLALSEEDDSSPKHFLHVTVQLSKENASGTSTSALTERILLFCSGLFKEDGEEGGSTTPSPHLSVAVSSATVASACRFRASSTSTVSTAPRAIPGGIGAPPGVTVGAIGEEGGPGFQVEGVLRILLPVSHCGAFMGRQGTAVREFQERTQSKCWLSKHTYDEDESSRVLLVVGDFDALKDALPEVARRLAAASAAAALEFGAPQAHVPSLRFLLSNRATGALIGRRGAGLKSLAAAVPGSKISISQLDHDSMSIRVVRVSGDLESICETATRILERLSTVDAADAFLGDTRAFVPGYPERRRPEKRNNGAPRAYQSGDRQGIYSSDDDHHGHEEDSDDE